jgi:PE-PGRS family protein with aspartyl peptidase-like domain
MAGRASAKYSRNTKARRCGVVMGGALSAFVAAAAMATGSAAPARADFEDLLDPILQPLLTSLTDSVATLDPAAAVDITSWTDSLLSSLGSVDVAAPAAAESAAASAASAEPAAAMPPYDLPINVYDTPATEPAVQATVDGGPSVPVLVDTGSSGLVIPWQDLGSGSEFQDLSNLGFPTSFGESGYTGGVDYLYLTYNLPVDYAAGLDTTTPVEVEVYSWDPSDFSSLFTNDAFQGFLSGNGVSGILGIGNDVSGGAGTSPFESYGSALVDLTKNELVVGGSNPYTALDTISGSGSTFSGLTETVTSGSTTVGTSPISDDLDTGGAFGTVPSAITTTGLSQGDVVTVSDGTKELYSYVVGAGDSPLVTSGTSIDSGYAALVHNPLYIDYATNTTSIDR